MREDIVDYKTVVIAPQWESAQYLPAAWHRSHTITLSASCSLYTGWHRNWENSSFVIILKYCNKIIVMGLLLFRTEMVWTPPLPTTDPCRLFASNFSRNFRKDFIGFWDLGSDWNTQSTSSILTIILQTLKTSLRLVIEHLSFLLVLSIPNT